MVHLVTVFVLGLVLYELRLVLGLYIGLAQNGPQDLQDICAPALAQGRTVAQPQIHKREKELQHQGIRPLRRCLQGGE
jgi:hypothetical protein